MSDPLWTHLEQEHGYNVIGLGDEDVAHWTDRHDAKLHKPGRYLHVPHSHPHLLTEQEIADADRAEEVITSLLAPSTPEETARRRVERDRENAATLRLITSRLRDRLTMDEKRVLVSVAHRLVKGEE